MQLDTVLGEYLKHRRILIEKLDNPSARVQQALHDELEATNTIAKDITGLLAEIRAKILG